MGVIGPNMTYRLARRDYYLEQGCSEREADTMAWADWEQAFGTDPDSRDEDFR